MSVQHTGDPVMSFQVNCVPQLTKSTALDLTAFQVTSGPLEKVRGISLFVFNL